MTAREPSAVEAWHETPGDVEYPEPKWKPITSEPAPDADLYAEEREALLIACEQYVHLAGSDQPSYLLGAANALLALRRVRSKPSDSEPASDADRRDS